MSLKQKAVSGILWKFVEQMSRGILAFTISIVLARLLDISDFGLIGMLAIFIALSSILIESGFTAALIQNKNRTNLDYNTVFLFNIFIALVCYAILFFCAPLIATFYGEPLLVSLLRVLGLNLILNSFNTIQLTQLTIKIDFKAIAKVTLTGSAAGGAVGVFMAYTGFGVWSLVAQTLTTTLFSTIVLWSSSVWRPHFVFSLTSLKRMFAYGSKLLIASVYGVSLNNLYNIIIGRVYKSEELGIYTRAMHLPELISATVNSVINSVTFPLMSSINDDRERMLSGYSRMLSMTAFIIFPIMTLLSALSYPFVMLFLTERWIAVVPLMQWLCFARMMTPISSLNLNILQATGRSDLFLWTDLAKLPLFVANIIITVPMGIKYIAIGSAIVTFISYFINAYFPGKKFGYGAIKQIRDCYKTIIAVGCMYLVVYILNTFVFTASDRYFIQLMVGGLLGIGVYIVCHILLKTKEVGEIVKIVKEKVVSLRKTNKPD